MNADTEVLMVVALVGVIVTWLWLALWLDAWLAGGLSRWVCSRVGHRWTEEAPEAVVVFENCSRCGEFKRAVLAREFGRTP